MSRRDPRRSRLAAFVSVVVMASVTLSACASQERGGRAPLPTPVFDVDTDRFVYLPVGTPLEIEVRLTLPDGSLATDYEWLWHAPEGATTSSPMPGVERLSLRVTRPTEAAVSGALRVCEDGDYVLCASAERDEAVPPRSASCAARPRRRLERPPTTTTPDARTTPSACGWLAT